MTEQATLTNAAHKRACFEPLLQALNRYESFWIASHIHPDPDAIGAQLALAHFLRRRGQRVEVVNQDEPPRITRYLPGIDWIHSEPTEREMDGLIVIDVSSLERIGDGLAGRLRPKAITINIDHHVTNESFADVTCTITEACASCAILFDFFEYSGEPIDPSMAECLYAGLIGDTGNFRFSNTNPHAHEIGAQLIRLGVRPHIAYEHIYGSRTEGQVLLLGRVLSTLRRTHSGLIVSMRVTREMFESTGTTVEDVDGFTDYARSIDGVKAVAFFGELPDGRIKVSLRSRSDHVVVNGVAKALGGGGHAYAAGCILDPPMDAAEARVLEALARVVPVSDPT